MGPNWLNLWYLHTFYFHQFTVISFHFKAPVVSCFFRRIAKLRASVITVKKMQVHIPVLYYSKFDKGQNFNFVCRRSCVSDTKFYDRYVAQLSLYKHVSFC